MLPPSTDIRKTVRGSVPAVSFGKIARKLLGPHYQLSVVICGDKLARKINRAHRHKDYAPNVLSFTLGKSEGEIFLNARKAAREAKQFGVSYRARLALLFIHGCLHLKGLPHGLTMEGIEQKTLRAFGIA